VFNKVRVWLDCPLFCPQGGREYDQNEKDDTDGGLQTKPEPGASCAPAKRIEPHDGLHEDKTMPLVADRATSLLVETIDAD